MQFSLVILALIPFAYATYDELSVLQEVLERTSSTSTEVPSTTITTTEPQPESTTAEAVKSETPIIPPTITIERILTSTISSVESSSLPDIVKPAVTGSPILPVDEKIEVLPIVQEEKEVVEETKGTETVQVNYASTASTVIASSEVPTTVESSSAESSSTFQASSASSSVSVETITTDEPAVEVTEEITLATAEPLIEVTTESDEHFFFGIKKPDLATIYRRLFPFQDQQDEFNLSF